MTNLTEMCQKIKLRYKWQSGDIYCYPVIAKLTYKDIL